jgi:hypothetical protein
VRVCADDVVWAVVVQEDGAKGTLTTQDLYGGASEAETAANTFTLGGDAFPDLSDDAARVFRNRYGASGRAASGTRSPPGALREEDFPTLGGGVGAGGGPGGAFRNAVAPYPTRAMILHNDRNDPFYYPDVPLDRPQGKKGPGKGGKKPEAKGPTPAELAQRQGSLAMATTATPSRDAPVPLPSPPPPPQAQAEGRDKHTVTEEIQGLLGDEAFQELRSFSRQLAQAEIEGGDYYDKVIELIPPREMRWRVMTDLLELLPDKQLAQDIRYLMDTRDGDPSVAPAPEPAPAPAPTHTAKAAPPEPKPKAKKAGPAKRLPKANDVANALAAITGGGPGPSTRRPEARKSGFSVVKFRGMGQGQASKAAEAAEGKGPPPEVMEAEGPGGAGTVLRLARRDDDDDDEAFDARGKWASKARRSSAGTPSTARASAAPPPGMSGARAPAEDDFPALPPPPPGFSVTDARRGQSQGAQGSGVYGGGVEASEASVGAGGGAPTSGQKKKGKKKPNELMQLAMKQG